LTATFDKFYSYLEELTSSYARLSLLLKEKIDAVERDDLGKLEEIMGEEQVYLLISRGFDQNIAEYRKTLGLKGDKLSDIVQEVPGEFRDEFAGIYSRLKESLDEAKTLNDNCQKLIKTKLGTVNKRLRELEGAKTANYGDPKKPAAPGSHIFSKSI
jgi:archaellum biogenesis protein FlaJ (TadC family)